MKTLIRRRILRRLIWVCTVCLCPKNGVKIRKIFSYFWQIRADWSDLKAILWFQGNLLSKISLYDCIRLCRFFSVTVYLSHVTRKPVFGVCDQGPVVQNIISLTKSLVNDSLSLLVCLKSSVLIFFAEKMWGAFALQKLLTFFWQKMAVFLCIICLKF